MSRRAIAGCSLIAWLVCPAVAAAQTRGVVSAAAGVTWLSEDPPGDFFPAQSYDTGWAVNASYTFLWKERVGPAFDIGRNERSNIVGETQALSAWLVGARIDIVRTRWFTPFAHVLFGQETFEEPGFSETGFAIQPGGGVDVALWKGLGIRAQGDYRFVEYDGDDGRYRNARAFLGVLVKLHLQ